jgi:hypothetical protein
VNADAMRKASEQQHHPLAQMLLQPVAPIVYILFTKNDQTRRHFMHENYLPSEARIPTMHIDLKTNNKSELGIRFSDKQNHFEVDYIILVITGSNKKKTEPSGPPGKQ